MTDFDLIAWDDEDDPEGNVQHVAEHDLSTEEVEDVLYEPHSGGESHSSGRPVVFGWTRTGRHIMVVYEVEEVGGFVIVHPVTAYEVPPPA